MTKRKLRNIAEYSEYIRRILVNGIWIAILMVILAGVGWFLLDLGAPGDDIEKQVVDMATKKVDPPVDWHKVDAALAKTLQTARQRSRDYADGELDIWIAQMMERVDNTFLDWYFSYWTQQLLGLKGLYQYGVHYVLENQPSASEKLTQEIQREFASRVLRPRVAQKRLERIIRESARIYVESLRQDLKQIPESYGVAQAEWRHYLEDIAITVGESQGGRHTPLTLKALSVSGVGSTALLAVHMKTMVGNITTKIVNTSSGKVASKMAAKTGGKVAAKVGGKFFGAIAGLGVLVWDVWDHSTVERNNRPLLRQSLQDYFAELKNILLDDPEFGIMAAFQDFEQQVASRSTVTTVTTKASIGVTEER